MYGVGIAGLGKIAAGYGAPADLAPYCHAGGIRQSSKVELRVVADVLPAARDGFRTKWGACFPAAKYCDSLETMLTDACPEIVAICVRGPFHFQSMMRTIAARPRAIFLEKPPSCSLQEMDSMVDAARVAGIPITVSYSRHWAPHILRMAQCVRDGLIGTVQTVVGYCGGTFLSFASHTTDLICQFAGYCPTAVFALGRVEGQAPDGYEPEPILTGMTIEFANGVTGIQVGADGAHGSFYCEAIGTEGRVRAGMYIPPAAADKQGKPIDMATLGIPGDTSPFRLAYDQIAGYLDGGPRPDCTDRDFMVVNEIGFAGIESVLTQQRVVLPNRHRSRRIYANG